MTEKKNILLVTNGFYPEISPRSFRATELAKEFCRLGHSVVVITKFRDHDYSNLLDRYNLTIKMYGKIGLPCVHSNKRRPLFILNRVLSRTLLILFEYPSIRDMFAVKKILKKGKQL